MKSIIFLLAILSSFNASAQNDPSVSKYLKKLDVSCSQLAVMGSHAHDDATLKRLEALYNLAACDVKGEKHNFKEAAWYKGEVERQLTTP